MKKIVLLTILIVVLSCSTVLASGRFYDVMGTKYEGPVERIYTLGIVNGISDHTFAYNRPVTRAEMAKIIVKMKGFDKDQGIISTNTTSAFSDVKRDDWFFEYVMIAQKLGIITGYEDGTFKPEKEVTYAEVVALLLRYLGYTNIKTESPYGWYWNYVVKMRDLELNDNIGEFDYETPALRGDVVMFVWNTLITTSWGITADNNITGFTYSYKKDTPLETYFDDFTFFDDVPISGLGGRYEGIGVTVGPILVIVNHKLPLYAKGGRLTALVKEGVLYGITYDERYPNTKVVSGPSFYLEEQGYKLASSNASYSFGAKNDNSYTYAVIDLDKNSIIRTVSINPNKVIMVDSISVVNNEEKEDEAEESKLTINEEEYSFDRTKVIKDGYAFEWESVQKGDCLVYLENGLYAYDNKTVQGTITAFNNKNEIEIDHDKYFIINDALCYLYTDKEPTTYRSFPSEKMKDYIGVEATVYLNAAEGVYKVELQKSDNENNKYRFGYVTVAALTRDTKAQMLTIQFGNEKLQTLYIADKDVYFEVGDLVEVHEEEGKYQINLIDKSQTYDNDIGLEYLYDAKTLRYPMIGEYMVTKDTLFYKVNQTYRDNSVTQIEKCVVEEIKVEDNLDDLEAYQLVFSYNEYMEVIKVFLINQINQFKHQVATIDQKVLSYSEGDEVYAFDLKILREPRDRYYVSKEDFEAYDSGDLILVSVEQEKEYWTATVVDSFPHYFIGYKRDLVVKDVQDKTVNFENGNTMYLLEDVYDWNHHKVNLNRFKMLLCTVEKHGDQQWYFNDVRMIPKEEIVIKAGDRIAINEMDETIVVYRGYEEL